MMDITSTIVAMGLSESHIKAVTVVKFYGYNMHKDGIISWENFKDNIDQVIQYQTRMLLVASCQLDLF